MRTLAWLLLALSPASLAFLACTGSEKVNPFPEAGAPCTVLGHIDCSQFPDTRCVVDSGTCSTPLDYGCVDAEYYSNLECADSASEE